VGPNQEPPTLATLELGSSFFELWVGLLELCQIPTMAGLEALAEDEVVLAVDHLPVIHMALGSVAWCGLQTIDLTAQFMKKFGLAIP
jgi:hypothetical protein